MAGTADAQEKPKYLCKDFVREFEFVRDQPAVEAANVSIQFNRAAAFILGAYYATTREDYSDTNDAGMAAFERQVVEACKSTPNERPSITSLRLARNLLAAVPEAKKGKPAPATSKNQTNVEVVGELPDVGLEVQPIEDSEFGVVRVVFEVTNRRAAPIRASMRCSLYGTDGRAIGIAGGVINMVPPGRKEVGEAIGAAKRVDRASCRLIYAHDQ
jgi:hypothetical protein